MADETPNQRQARLRRERREAKIRAEGSSRLEKITNAAGRQNLAESFSSQPPDSLASSPAKAAKPKSPDTLSDFVDPQGSTNLSQQPSEADIRAFLQASAPPPDFQTDRNHSSVDDPMVKMFAELMGGLQPGTSGTDAPPSGIPPNLASLLGNLGGNDDVQSAKQQRQAMKDDLTWRIIHVLFAFALGIYVIVTSSTLRGPLIRIKGKVFDHEAQRRDGLNFFWAFTTVELVLQSTRYFLERGKASSNISGLVGTISAFLPEPWAGHIRLAARYSGIWTTVVEDACVLIFIIGIFSWWKGTPTLPATSLALAPLLAVSCIYFTPVRRQYPHA